MSALQIIIVEKDGKQVRNLNVKCFNIDELYRKCGFKTSDNFIHLYEWKEESSDITIALYGKKMGRSNNVNKYIFPGLQDEIFYGSCALVALQKDIYIDLPVNIWLDIENRLFMETKTKTKTETETEKNQPLSFIDENEQNKEQKKEKKKEQKKEQKKDNTKQTKTKTKTKTKTSKSQKNKECENNESENELENEPKKKKEIMIVEQEEWCVQNIDHVSEQEGFENLVPEENEQYYFDETYHDLDEHYNSLNHLRQPIVDVFNKKINNKVQAFDIEIGIFNYTLQEAGRHQIVKKWINPLFTIIYLSKSKSVWLNLHDPIIKQLQSGELLARKIAFMTHQELLPEIWMEAIEKKNKKDSQKYETKLVATTNTFTCYKCGSNQCNHYLLQTRSSDEPMTCYVTCLNCGKKWKT
jgi:hypothetical protein